MEQVDLDVLIANVTGMLERACDPSVSHIERKSAQLAAVDACKKLEKEVYFRNPEELPLGWGASQ
jgi:hypothetical protein